MNFNSTSNNFHIFSSVDEIPEEIWLFLQQKNTVYLQRNFLNAIEKNHLKTQFLYLVLFDERKIPKAFITLQIIDFYLETIKNNLQSFVKKIENIASKLHMIPATKPLKLLIGGNPFVSGEYGIFIDQNQNKKIVIKELAKAILTFVNTDERFKNKIDFFLLKDFIKESLFITNELKDYNYHPFSVEPNMVLKLDEKWQNFDDYLAALKTKFRVKAKKAISLSKDLKIENVTLENIEVQLPVMTYLYTKVVSNAGFNLDDFNLETYRDLKANFGENYILKTFYYHDKMVGFMSGIINQKSLDAHFVGLDYELNRTHAIYQKMLYTYINIAISKKLKIINFGRTASEIKSSVGAEPQDLTIYLRHKKNITNKILKVFLQRVQPTPFSQKFPFKLENPL